jgi:hypothetical protein
MHEKRKLFEFYFISQAATKTTNQHNKRKILDYSDKPIRYTRHNTVKKASGFPVPRRDVTHQTPWRGIIKLFPARESFVSDIPAGDGKTANLF